MEAVRAKCKKPGYTVVMIHHTTDRRLRDEDQLAAMVIRELRKLDIFAAVMHSAVGHECYRLINGPDGRPCYVPRKEARGKLSGYLRMVALNKVLLTNQRWPFVLSTPLNADLTVGVDVKQNTAGLVVVGRNGADIRAIFRTSRQKEQLLEEQLEAYLIEIIREEVGARSEPIRIIVIHRDGRIWPSEIAGARKALEFLKREGIVDPGAILTILEIAKSSPAPLRFFDVVERDGQARVYNPQVGLYHISNDDAYLCATGRAFPRPGTVKPLHVRHVEGPLPLEKCLEDVYCLTGLAWTRPDDCTRYPITIKLNDRFLGEEAGEYDAEALDYKATLGEEAITA
jgi:argonaute-like protein implicated in RNA metabolism and viral defense